MTISQALRLIFYCNELFATIQTCKSNILGNTIFCQELERLTHGLVLFHDSTRYLAFVFNVYTFNNNFVYFEESCIIKCFNTLSLLAITELCRLLQTFISPLNLPIAPWLPSGTVFVPLTSTDTIRSSAWSFAVTQFTSTEDVPRGVCLHGWWLQRFRRIYVAKSLRRAPDLVRTITALQRHLSNRTRLTFYRRKITDATNLRPTTKNPWLSRFQERRCRQLSNEFAWII